MLNFSILPGIVLGSTDSSAPERGSDPGLLCSMSSDKAFNLWKFVSSSVK